MENLGRGIVGVRTGASSIFVSWRLLGLDPAGIGFNLYRSTAGGTAVKLNSSVLTAGTNFTDATPDITKDNAYYVKPVLNGTEQAASGSYTVKANTTAEPCIVIPLQKPASGYYTKFVWAGDLDGDGEYDFVMDRLAPGNPNVADVTIGDQFLEAYKRDGTRLWSIDMGPGSMGTYNISPGPATLSMGMYDGATVYDLNGDGKAEVILKVADGVVFADGTVFHNSDPNKQFLAIVDGMTGKMLANIAFPTDFYAQSGKYGCQLAIAYLDAKTPSVVSWLRNRNADKSFNDIMVAWHWDGKTLSQVWKLPIPAGTPNIAGDHQMVVADVDGDGYDEICPGNYWINHDGTLRYALGADGVIHGDRHYVTKMDPSRKGLQSYGIQQDNASGLAEYYYDANTGEMLWQHMFDTGDVSRGLVGHIDPRYKGWEAWSWWGIWFAPTNTQLTVDPQKPYPCHTFWWDGDLLSENLNDQKFEKWDYVSQTTGRLLTSGDYENAVIADHNPMLSGDLFGDWRTEVVEMSSDMSKMVIFTTDIPTDTRIYTMAHNPEHRCCMTIKGYYQSPLVDYYLGTGMDTPPVPNIVYVGGTCTATPIVPYIQVNGGTWQNVSSVTVNSGDAVILGPQPITGGSWSWTGCGTSGTARQQTIAASGTCTSTATYTNTCGAKSTQNFTITVNGSTTGIVSGGTYTITAKNSGKVLDVTGASTADGALIDQLTSTGGTNQQWKVTDIGGGVYNISSVTSGKLMDVVGRSTTAGASIDQWHSTGGNWQQFNLVDAGSGYYNIIAVNSQLCIDVTGSSSADGAQIEQWTCNGHDNQKFSFTQLKSAPVIAAATIPQSNTMSIAPNPVDGSSAQLTIGLDAKSEVNILVIDYLGKIVCQKNLGVREAGVVNETLDLTSVAKGTYIIKVQTKDGTKTTKLVRL
jgi:hypothetical protein